MKLFPAKSLSVQHKPVTSEGDSAPCYVPPLLRGL